MYSIDNTDLNTQKNDKNINIPNKKHNELKKNKDNNKNKNLEENLNDKLKLVNKTLWDKYKKELTSFIVNKESIYPKMNGCKNGNSRLEDIFKYLKSCNYSKIYSNKKVWPIFKCGRT